ncbi:hypothetical protein D3C71_2025570 [compost metagenome]
MVMPGEQVPTNRQLLVTQLQIELAPGVVQVGFPCHRFALERWLKAYLFQQLGYVR